MKYRILVLLVLVCAVLVAAAGGTLAGYTSETTFSFSIRPDMRATPHARQSIEAPVVTATTPDAQTADIEGVAPDQADSDIAPDIQQ